MRGFIIFAAVFAGSVGIGLAAIGAFYLAEGRPGMAALEFGLAGLDFALCAVNAHNAMRTRGA